MEFLQLLTILSKDLNLDNNLEDPDVNPFYVMKGISITVYIFTCEILFLFHQLRISLAVHISQAKLLTQIDVFRFLTSLAQALFPIFKYSKNVKLIKKIEDSSQKIQQSFKSYIKNFNFEPFWIYSVSADFFTIILMWKKIAATEDEKKKSSEIILGVKIDLWIFLWIPSR